MSVYQSESLLSRPICVRLSAGHGVECATCGATGGADGPVRVMNAHARQVRGCTTWRRSVYAVCVGFGVARSRAFGFCFVMRL